MGADNADPFSRAPLFVGSRRYRARLVRGDTSDSLGVALYMITYATAFNTSFAR